MKIFQKNIYNRNENQDANDDFFDIIDDNINVNSLLFIQNFIVCRSKDKSAEILNKNRRKQTFEIFTQRELLRFEHV